MVCFSQESIHEIIEGKQDSSQIYFKKEEIGGIIVSIPPDDFEALLNICSNKNTLLYFLRLGTFGSYLEPYDDDFTKIIIFHFPITPKNTQSELLQGYFIGEIEDLIKGRGEELWDNEEYADLERLIDKAEYLRFSKNIPNYSETIANALIISELTYIDVSEENEDFINIVNKIDGEKGLKYYEEKLDVSGLMTSYINKNIASHFIELCQKKQTGQIGVKKENILNVFISYSNDDTQSEDVVKEIAEQLNELNITHWIDGKNIKVNDTLPAQISNAIKSATHFIALINQEYIRKGWTMREFSFATALETSEGSPQVIPIYIDDKNNYNEIIKSNSLPLIADKVIIKLFEQKINISKLVHT